ncbi:PepSY1/2 domain-containing protein [Desulfosporosinus sp. BICA1-9]|uniref:PepSY1/2 domain-containing protein n=1 Tax=Desulfosporosinus sp. BICA1-9 TaxID=1531958 RepID=UPI00054BBF06|nr:PepSY1/2 domain-containing protein [Desulfosporosinus sp. BICA1-9]KJS46585.1 MAG: spore gernimation protein [Peptococcaceae bacterium BRH_c23]KJS87367.1 MAG: spore gernimation protein [Desulfosporosinus sp. BICA1-9]HBW36590.1 spore gernimation protein [Desulfosporosinus sp.]
MHRKVWIGALTLAFVISLGWGVSEYRQAEKYRLADENNNRRALTDFASHLDQLETDLAKGDVASNPAQKILYLSQVSSKSDSALKDFAQIPAEQAGLSYVGQFLTQSGDFAKTLAQRIAGGGTMTTEEEKTLRDMHERLMPVNQKVQDLITRIDTENLVWTDPAPSIKQRLGFGTQVAEASADGSETLSKSVRSGLDQLDASLQKLPPFSYTGEYATRVVEKPLGLPAGEVTRDQALAKVRDFLSKIGYANTTPELDGETQGELGGYKWKINEAYMEVSRQGGVITLFRDQRSIEPRTISIEEAAKKANAALQSLGWQLVITSSEDFGSYVQFDAVVEENGVRIYPDKVRLMIALDNGKLVGLDTVPYYAFHHSRTFPKKLTMDQVLRKLRPNFQVVESRLAVIVKSGNQEIYCYEFRGRYQGEEYLLYLNAATGVEENIRRIIKTPRGEYLK